jgi:hypothetical protein
VLDVHGSVFFCKLQTGLTMQIEDISFEIGLYFFSKAPSHHYFQFRKILLKINRHFFNKLKISMYICRSIIKKNKNQ